MALNEGECAAAWPGKPVDGTGIVSAGTGAWCERFGVPAILASLVASMAEKRCPVGNMISGDVKITLGVIFAAQATGPRWRLRNARSGCDNRGSSRH